MFKKIIALFFVLSITSLFASSASGETDFLPRAVNFLIFAGIMYYILADKLKAFFTGRIDKIKGDLDKVQELLKESKRKKEEALANVEKAKQIAKDLIVTTNKEAKAISEKIDEHTKIEIDNLVKHMQEAMDAEKRKVIKSVAQEVVQELLNDDAINISNDKIIEIINKKVA